MNKVMKTEILINKYRDKKQKKKNLTVNLSELIQIKKMLMSSLKLVKYKITLLSQPKNYQKRLQLMMF